MRYSGSQILNWYLSGLLSHDLDFGCKKKSKTILLHLFCEVISFLFNLQGFMWSVFGKNHIVLMSCYDFDIEKKNLELNIDNVVVDISDCVLELTCKI